MQVEERLDYLSGGAKPKKNIDVMKEIYNKLKAAEEVEGDGEQSDNEKMLKKKKKRSKEAMNIKDEEEVEEPEKKKKKKKKVVVESESD